MHNPDLVLTLTAGFAVALVFGFLALRFRLPSIVGYLLAGLLLGPYTPGYIANHEIAQQLAEIGVILLMFGVGLHFHLKDLLAVRRVALTGAICEITILASVGTAVSRSLASHGPEPFSSVSASRLRAPSFSPASSQTTGICIATRAALPLAGWSLRIYSPSSLSSFYPPCLARATDRSACPSRSDGPP